MSRVFGRHNRKQLPVAVDAKGCWFTDQNGKQYLDACGGAAVSCLGHGDQDIIEATQRQLGSMAWAHTSFFSSEPAERLADKLVAHAPEGIEHVYFVSGGSEATEAAIKLARQYFVETGRPEKKHLIARRQSYHGNTLGALAAGGNQWRRAPFSPLLMPVSHIAPCYPYREQRVDESPAEYALRAANELEAEILRLGADNVMAFIAEPVVGATVGALVPPTGYFQRIREICDQYDVLLILDEVMCGMGRTGYLFASEADHISPDIVCIAKGLGAGYQPIGAMLCSGEIYKAITNGSGFFQHGHTYIAHPTACAAALAVLEKLTEPQMMSTVMARGQYLFDQLNQRLGAHPFVGDIRGRGLFWGVELVQSKTTRAPFDSSLGLAAKVKAAAFENGLMCYPMSGTIDGLNGDHVLLAPPFVISEAELDLLVDRLETAINQCTQPLAQSA